MAFQMVDPMAVLTAVQTVVRMVEQRAVQWAVQRAALKVLQKVCLTETRMVMQWGILKGHMKVDKTDYSTAHKMEVK